TPPKCSQGDVLCDCSLERSRSRMLRRPPGCPTREPLLDALVRAPRERQPSQNRAPFIPELAIETSQRLLVAARFLGRPFQERVEPRTTCFKSEDFCGKTTS